MTRHTASHPAVLVALVPLLGRAACNTTQAVGRDVQAGGKAIEDAAEATGEAIDEALEE